MAKALAPFVEQMLELNSAAIRLHPWEAQQHDTMLTLAGLGLRASRLPLQVARRAASGSPLRAFAAGGQGQGAPGGGQGSGEPCPCPKELHTTEYDEISASDSETVETTSKGHPGSKSGGSSQQGPGATTVSEEEGGAVMEERISKPEVGGYAS
ncbi:hypothetical protein N2152v2_011082 [Parachlorella kessleri]